MAQHDACRLTKQRVRVYDMSNVPSGSKTVMCRRTKPSLRRSAAGVEGECAKRIAKGGSWGSSGKPADSGRFSYAPTHRDDSIGFRVAKTLR